MPLEEGEIIDTDLVNNYSIKYVVFLDLLGFSELVKRSGADVLERHRLVEALRLVRDTLCENQPIDFRFTYFSDCIVISAVYSPHALWQLFQSVEVLTCNLLQYDILLSGSLTVGPTHHSRDFVFGTAVTEANKMERKLAVNPLVLLSPAVVQEVEALGPEFKQWLKEDGQDRFFDSLPHALRGAFLFDGSWQSRSYSSRTAHCIFHWQTIEERSRRRA
jgi:hypothetical protein